MAVIFVSTGVGLSGGPITSSGTISLLPPTSSNIGGVKAGANITISPDGTISTAPPGIGTITGVTAGTGLTGGGNFGSVTLGLSAATTTTIGGVIIGSGLEHTGAIISLKNSSLTERGGVILASASDVSSGINAEKVVTPATLLARIASTSQTGLVQLEDSTSSTSTTKAATPRSVKFAYDQAASATALASNALPLTGGVMVGPIIFAAGQTFPGVSLPLATLTTPGVVIPSTGLAISLGGYLTTVNNGTVTSITAGTGLGAPVSGNSITSTGTINLLPPSSDGTKIGGVKAGSNISIQIDGEISTEGVLQTNNPYAYNSYLWPATTTPVPGAPGTDNQVLTLLNRVTGEIGWTSTGKINAVNAGSGLTATTVNGVATVSLANVGIPAATVGATALTPTFSFNASGQIISHGLANPYSPFLAATVTAPPNLVLNFADNNTNWQWTLNGNISIQAPINSQPGQRGSLLLTQSPTPSVVTWHIAWKGIGSYSGPAAGQVDLIDFVVVAGNQIVVTNIVSNVG